MADSRGTSRSPTERPILCVGEALIDLIATPADSWADIDHFVPRIGGAPANGSVAIQRLGGSGAFLGCLANDDPGDWIRQTLEAESVDLSRAPNVNDAQTRLATVTGSSDHRDFVFYGSPPADSLLTPEHIDASGIERASAVMVGSLLLLSEPGRSAMYRLLELAIQHRIPVTFDPNPRPKSWPDPDRTRARLLPFVRAAKILKLNVSEPAIMGMTASEIRGQQPEDAVLVLTDGRNGCWYWYGDVESRLVPAVSVDTVDATGAGDCFTAALTLRSIERGGGIDETDVRFAAAAGALATTKLGAMEAIPFRPAVEEMMKE